MTSDEWWKRLGPPWVMFSRSGDNMVDILPAMRPGHVLEGVPIELARTLITAANRLSTAREERAFARIEQGLEVISRRIEAHEKRRK